MSAGASPAGRAFWRSLDELADDPGLTAAIAERFPALGSIAQGWERRDILKCLGGAVALAGLDACERVPDEEAMPLVSALDGMHPGETRYYASAVELGGVAQPIVGKTVDGRPIKLEGNPDFPGGSATDAFTQAELLGLYDPDRSAAPVEEGRPSDWARFVAAAHDLRGALDASAGRGFRLLTGPVGSPTLHRQIAALLDRWPEAAWHLLDPAPIHRDHRLHLDRAEAIVAIDDDLLGPGPLQLWHAQGWAARRRAYQQGDGDALLFVAEPSPTISGATASERLVAPQAAAAQLLVALAAELGVEAGPRPALTSTEAAWIDSAADALRRHRGAGLVTVGEHHPPALHALAQRIDAALGNDARRGAARGGPQPQSADALLAAMLAGDVSTLFMLDVNPGYFIAGFDELAGAVPLRIHAGLHRDESAILAHWHLPLTHALESWSDGCSAAGLPTLTQPLVRPWLAARSRHAVLAALLGDERSDRAIVRASWPALADDAAWEAALRAGRPPGDVEEGASNGGESAMPVEVPGFSTGLELVVRPDPSLWDGRFASNPWLQELPKPLTKICWGNGVQISPALARELGLENGDRVRVSVGARHVDGPVWILPGQARRTILIHLGHGRRAGSRVAEGVGFDATPLARATGRVRIERLEGREEIATTQHHFAMEEDEYIRFVERAGDRVRTEPPPASFFPPQKSRPAWGMGIDLDLCIGCNACVVACIAENNIPMVGREQVAMGREMHWLRVDRYYSGTVDAPEHAFQPVPCMHCEDAPCEMGCPVNATVHSPDGLNLQIYNRCIGTRTCSAYCPYKVRRFNWFDLTGDDPPERKAVRNPDVTVRQRGVMEKCTYCIQRIEGARIDAKKEDRAIRDGEVVTACQAACPTGAIVFGDVADPASAVSARKADGRDYDLLPDANTRPRTTYQARIRKGDTA